MRPTIKDAQFIPPRVHKWKLVIEDLKQPIEDHPGQLVHHSDSTFSNYRDARAAFYKLPLMSDIEHEQTRKALGRAWLIRDDGTALQCSYVRDLPEASQYVG